MTPFDVIKTRIQTQTTQEPLFQASRSNPPSTTCCHSEQIAEKPSLLCQHDPRIESNKLNTDTIRGTSRNAALSGIDEAATNRARVIRFIPQGSSSSISAISCNFSDRHTAVQELEMARNSGRMAGLWDGVTKIGRAEGPKGLWRGLTPTL